MKDFNKGLFKPGELPAKQIKNAWDREVKTTKAKYQGSRANSCAEDTTLLG